MNRLITAASIGAIAALCTVALAAQTSAGRAAVEKTLMEQEQKINDAFAKSDAAGMKMFIADDAMAADASGVTPIAQFFKDLPTMQVKITEQKLTDFKPVWVDANTVVLTYTWSGKGTVMGQPAPSPTYSATVWNKRGDKWLAVFHQETAAAPPPKTAAPTPAKSTTKTK